MANHEFVGRNLDDIDYMQLTIGFPDDKGYAVPLTSLQAAIVLRKLGFFIDSDGDLMCLTDDDLKEGLRKEKEIYDAYDKSQEQDGD